MNDDSLNGLDKNELKEFFNGLDGVDENFLNFVEKVDSSGNIIEQYQQHLKDTSQATSTFSSFTKKAGNVIKGFTAGLASIGVNMAIGMLFNAAATAIDNWIHRVEKARERTAELLQEFSEMRETHSNHKETVANYADRFDELSKGVDLSNNKNLSLSTEEYKEFLDINKQLSESFPTLKTNIDENGNAILTLGTKGITAKEQLQELLDTEENLNNFKISQGLGEAFKGVYTYIEDANKAQEELNKINNKTDEQMGILPDYVENSVTLKKDNYQLFKGNTAEETKINYANTIQSAAQQFLDGLDDDRRIELESKGLNSSGLFTMVTDDLTGNFDFYANLYTLTPDEISSIENLISENVTELNGALTDEFSAQKTELEEQVQAGKYAWADFLPNLVAGMKSKQTFQNLDADLQDNIEQLVGNMDYTAATEMKKYNPDPYVYIRDNIIGPIGELSDADEISKAKGTLNSLLKLDKDDLSSNNQASITQLLGDLSEILNKDPVEIRTVLGYDMSDEQDSYTKSLIETKKKLNGKKRLSILYRQGCTAKQKIINL